MSILAPLLLFSVVQAIYITTLAFSSAHSTIRPLALLVSGVLALLGQIVVPRYSENGIHNSFLLPFAWIHWLNALDMLLLRRIYYPMGVSIKGDDAKPASSFAKLSWAFGALFELQAARFPWRIKSPRAFSSSDPSYIPSRAAFLIRRILAIIIDVIIMDFSVNQPASDVQVLFGADKERLFSRLGEVTREELIARVVTTLVFWLNLSCVVGVVYDTGAVIGVGLGWHSAADWPPLLGSLGETWSLRQLWGSGPTSRPYDAFFADGVARHTWHQMLRRPLTANADFVAGPVLGVPKGTLVSRYLRLLLVFALSGAIHFAADMALGLSWTESGSLRFFLMQALAIMFEDGVQELSRRALGGRVEAGWGRVVGYAWLLCFLIWTTPSWTYPQTRAIDPAKDRFLPFTIFGHLKPRDS